MAAQDVRTLVPRIRRAIEGAGAAEVLTDDAIKDLAADAIAAIILYSQGSFGHDLNVTEYDAEIPSEYEVDPAVSLPEQTLLATQAALDYFFFRFAGMKMSERIADEAQSWEYTLSPNLLRDQLKALQKARDDALGALGWATSTAYVSFLEVRDAVVSRAIEPWVDGAFGGGQELDVRFGVVG